MVTDKKIILFDGVCNLCNSTVQFIIRHDKKDQFRFASLQGKTGQRLLKKCNLPSGSLQSFILVEKKNFFIKSTGALRVAKYLGAGWPLLYAFIIIPAFIRNGVYNWIARNRYRWFGKQATCPVPTPELQSKFLE